MKITARLFVTATAMAATVLATGCATQPAPNYGHPALYAQPQVVVVQQPAQVVYAAPPVYRQGYSQGYGYAAAPVYSQSYSQPYQQPYAYAPGYAQAPAYSPAPAPRDNAGRAIVGGLVGGLIGSRFGKGEGRVATTAIGAGLGTWMAVRD